MSVRPGARGFFQSRSAAGWQNPYVTDGLVAMWDGIWNVGGGVEHDSDSPVWWDCIGGLPIVAPFSNAHFSSNAFVRTSDSNSSAGYPVGAIPGSGSGYGYAFMELVCAMDATTSNTTPYILGSGSRAIWLHRSANSVGIQKGQAATWTGGGIDLSTNQPFSVCADYGDTSSELGVACWINGQLAAHTGPADRWTLFNTLNNRVMLGYGNGYFFFGSFHAIRYYSRTLTAEEIAANYAIDKARFNLP